MPTSINLLSSYDLFLTPIYFLLIILWLIRWKKKRYKNSQFKKYIIPAFALKTLCCILLALLYQFYYGYSDSYNYYHGALEIWNATKSNPLYGLELVFKPFEKCSLAAQEFAIQIADRGYVDNFKYMYKISGFIGMFCFGTYLPIALVITLLSFLGSWKIFIVFAEEFPKHYKKIAVTCLFAPSFVFWSTNIMKDPLCIFGLGLCVSALYNFMKGRFNFFMLVEMIIGALIMLSLKSYIFYLFCVAGFCSIYVNYITSLDIRFKMLMRWVMVLTIVAATIFVLWQRANLAEAFSSGFMREVMIIQNNQRDAGGSVYVLSNADDLSFVGIIKTYFNSLNVALFRPYLWEAPNLIAIANATESFVILLFSFYLLLKLKIVGFFTFAFKNRILTFALIFTLILAPLAGLVSFNFGTLVRYKTPVVPFYYTYLILLYYKTREKKVDLQKTKIA